MAWEQDVESWKVIGKNTCHRNSILFRFEIIRGKLRDTSHEYESISKREGAPLLRSCCCAGCAAGFWRFAVLLFPKTAILHPAADPAYLGAAERQGTDPVAANMAYVASLDGAEELLNHSDKDRSVS